MPYIAFSVIMINVSAEPPRLRRFPRCPTPSNRRSVTWKLPRTLSGLFKAVGAQVCLPKLREGGERT
jgi:hypothetical protein